MRRVAQTIAGYTQPVELSTKNGVFRPPRGLPIFPRTLQNAPAVSSTLSTNPLAATPRPVAWWLVAVALLVFAMVTIGGVTRLTRSGLSIVEWNPIMGAVPPLTEQHWNEEFEKYRRTPEYQQVNRGMSLEAFQRIYYVEWTHRLLGRLIGLVFFLPLVYFALRKRLTAALTRRLIVIFVLGGAQGALGWFMVKSGLVDVPRVSPYRLTAHLALAVIIYGYLVWTILDLIRHGSAIDAPVFLRRLGWIVTTVIFVMILAGGFVAGTKAGFAFNTFPLMNGHWVPDGLYALQPWWINWFENIATVQFNHRVLAYAVFALVVYYWWQAHRTGLPAGVRLIFHTLFTAVVVQIALGIATLLFVVPVALGALHQAGALVVLTASLVLNHALSPRTTQQTR